jgi:HK97 family phage portal protein
MSTRDTMRRLAFHGGKIMQHRYGEYMGTPREPRLTVPSVEKADGAVTSTLGGLGWPQPMLYAALGGYASNTGVAVTPFTALQSAAVYSCVRAISQDIAMLRPFVRRRVSNGFKIDLDHPLNKLFAKPNRWQTWFEYQGYVMTSLCLRGNAYTVVERDNAGNPVELVPIAPDRVTIMLSEEGELWYRINSRRLGYGLVVPPDDMMHLKNISMDGYMGVSPIAISQDVIGLALATQQHGGILFRQGGQIAGVIKFPHTLSKEASDRIANSWREVHAGVQNSHKVAVLEEGGSFEKIAMTNEDSQFLETRRFQVVDICRIYGVPPHRLGELDKATLNNIEQQNQQYVDSALKPTARGIEELFNHHLLFEDERPTRGCVFDFDDMTRGDLKTRYEAYQIGTLNGWLNRNEVRARENLSPIDDGHGDEYRVPLNTAVPGANLAQTTTPPKVPTDAPGENAPKPKPEGADATD